MPTARRRPSLWIAAVVALTAGRASAAGLGVERLRCEYLVDPLGLDVLQPRLSWSDTGDHRAARQTAYRLLVATSAAELDRDHGDLWDTGKVASGQSTQLAYAGRPLTSGQACFWKVQAWDDRGQSAGWGPAGRWTVGLLKRSDWAGQWIGSAPEADDKKSKVPPPAPLLRKVFAVDKPVRRATATVCAMGNYELSLNGRKVGDHVLDPPVSQFNRRALYVTHDVTGQLAQGRNAVGIELGSSWYDTTVPDAWAFQKAPWRARPQVLFQLDLEYADGTRDRVVSDGSWKISAGAITFDQTRIAEFYDARLEEPGWTTAGYDDGTWQRAAVRDGNDAVISASNAEPIKVVATVEPVAVAHPQPGLTVFDLGQNLAGLPRLTVTGPAGTVVRLRCGERLHPDGTVDMADIAQHVRDKTLQKDFQCDAYTLKGGGPETYEPKFTYHGFQYVQLEGLPAGATATVEADVVRTAFEPGGSFTCSDPMLNKIEHAAEWAYASNFVGIPTDCPHREKNGWTGDAQLAVAMGLEHFRGEAAYTQWIQTLEDGQRPDGKLACIAPTPGWGYNLLDGPAWESAYFLIPWEMYVQSGDARVLSSHYDGYKKWLGWYRSKAKNGVVGYGLGDWAPVKTQTPTGVTSTGYYYRDLQIAAATADLLGKADEAAAFRTEADHVRAGFTAAFYDAATGKYAGGTQTAQSCAIYQGLVADADRTRVADNLVAAVHAADDHIDTGILGAKYLLRALSDTGHADLAWTVATQRSRPSWGGWIDAGATTLWEEWDGSSSRNHIMFGDISAWFVEDVAGLRADPTKPGFAHFVVRPLLLGDLTSASATRVTLHGTIRTGWTKADGRLTLTIDVPANTTATVYVPAAGDVTESDKPAADAVGVKFVRRDGGAAVYDVGSGSYSFATALK